MKKEILEESPIILREFLGYLQTIKGKSIKTVEEYFFDIRTFFRYLKLKNNLVSKDENFEKISILDVDIDLIKKVNVIDIFEYMNYLMVVRNNKEAARSRKVSSLHTFYRYLVNKSGKLNVNPAQELETPKLPKKLPKFLTLEESKNLLASVKKYCGKFEKRDYCILTLFLNCGLRLSELAGINLNDYSLEYKTLKVKGKGAKERVVYLNEACENALKEYINVRPKDCVKDRDALFISRQNNRLSVKTIQLLVSKYLQAAGLGNKGYSTHKLRHTAATLMYQYGGVDIRVLQEILGHENLGTTEIYTHLSNNQMKNAIDSNPLSKNI